MSGADFEPDDEPALLSLGVMSGGMTKATEDVNEAFMVQMRRVRDARLAYPNHGLHINVVFHIPGHLHSPDFEGVFRRGSPARRLTC